MKWFQVDKSSTKQPPVGSYADWKPMLREEGRYQCVYCAIHEGRFGGLRNFHVEHYKPKSKFEDLTNVVENLFYACAVCNTFKGSDWPRDPAADFSNAAYPDPSSCCYSTILEVDDNHLVGSSTVAGRYLVERLHLNRRQLINARTLSATLESIDRLRVELAQCSSGAPDGLKDKLIEVLLQTIDLLRRLATVRPYEPTDVRR